VAEDSAAPALAKVPARVGIIPTTVEEVWRLASMFARSELVPKSFRGKPDDIVVAITIGSELGFTPMQALQSLAVINGRPVLYSEGLLGLIMASPLYVEHDEYFEIAPNRLEVEPNRREEITAEDLKLDTTAAVCTFIRRDKPLPVTRRFSVGDARRAGLLNKPGPWVEYPSRMLRMRARSFAARDTFPDVLRGIRAVEEARDIPPEAAQARSVRRLSDPPEPEPAAAAAPDEPAAILDAELADHE
jgi:hypothetical protein